MSRSWVWINADVVLAIHEEQLAEHGGSAGVRDLGLLYSALSRPKHLDAYAAEELTGTCINDIAAAYGYGLAKNHPFVDGNKRTALVCTELFLALNGYELLVSDEECVMITLALASGELKESEFSDWIATHMIEKSDPS